MSPEVKDVLVKAHGLLMSHDICFGAMALDASGHSVIPLRPGPISFCSLGALYCASHEVAKGKGIYMDLYLSAVSYLHERWGSVVGWHEAHSHDEIIAAWTEMVASL